jgi:superoxide reductase
MDQRMQRRDFLRSSALLAGGVLLAAGTAAAEKDPQKLIGYAEVDQELFRGINRVRDPAKKTELEKKHAPLIEVPEKISAGVPFAVKVTVGEIVHPMVNGHFIQYIELFAGNEPAGRVDLRPGLNQPVVTFQLMLDKPLTLVAREYCNLHGLWESRKDLTLG